MNSDYDKKASRTSSSEGVSPSANSLIARVSFSRRESSSSQWGPSDEVFVSAGIDFYRVFYHMNLRYQLKYFSVQFSRSLRDSCRVILGTPAAFPAPWQRGDVLPLHHDCTASRTLLKPRPMSNRTVTPLTPSPVDCVSRKPQPPTDKPCLSSSHSSTHDDGTRSTAAAGCNTKHPQNHL